MGEMDPEMVNTLLDRLLDVDNMRSLSKSGGGRDTPY